MGILKSKRPEPDSEAAADSGPHPTRAKSLSKMLRMVENERFTVEIDSENAILDCTLER